MTCKRSTLYVAILVSMSLILPHSTLKINANPLSCSSTVTAFSSLFAKGRMPVFDEDDEEELRNIINGVQSQARQQSQARPKPPPPSSSLTTPSLPLEPKQTSISQPSSSYSKALPRSPHKAPSVLLPPLVKPNNDWRSAKSDANPYVSALYNAKQPPTIEQDDMFSITDLDYSDFEAAMREVESGGLGLTVSKESAAPRVEYKGLKSGDIIPASLWGTLTFADGAACEIEKLLKPGTDILLIYADPRRMAEEYRMTIKQLATLPQQQLRVSLAAANMDDTADLRKFIKKNTFPSVAVPLLSDTSKKFMAAVKCRSAGWLEAALLMIHIPQTSSQTGSPANTRQGEGILLKAWYGDEWDAASTREQVLEEMRAYREDPRGFVESQVDR